MSVSTVNGKGASAASGSSSSASTEFAELFNINYAALADATLSTGDNTIDGITHTLVETIAATSKAVGATHGGLKLGLTAATTQGFHLGTKNAPHIKIALADLLVGTDAEGRDDYEIQLLAELGFEGTHTLAAYEGLVFGLGSDTYSSAIHDVMYIGNYNDLTYRLESFAPGTARGAVLLGTGTTPALTYYAPCLRLTFGGGLRKFEYSDDGDTLSSPTWNTLGGRITTAANIPILAATGAGNEAKILFGCNKFTTGGGITSITLKRLVGYGRPSPSGAPVFLA